MRLALSLILFLLLSPSAWALPAQEVGLGPDGSLVSPPVNCSASLSCAASLWARGSLLDSRLGGERRSTWVRVTAAREGSAGDGLRFTSSGAELLRSQPDGVVFRLEEKPASGEDSVWRRVRLRFPRLLDLSVSPLFSPGSTLIDPEGAAVASSSLPEPSTIEQAVCIGHTDSAGPREDNIRVAYERASAVCRELSVGSYKVYSRGESEPRASNQTPEGRALNRRVEVRLSYVPSPALSRPDLGIHSMLKPGMSEEEVQQTFAAARDAGITMLRFDLSLNYVGQYIHVYPGMYDFAFLDMVRLYARRYGVRLLAVATWSPQSITECPDAEGYRCPPTQAAAWTDLLVAAARRAPEIKYWEIWNEPNSRYWRGTAAQYAALFDAALRSLHSLSPANQVALGGPAGLDRQWLSELLPLLEERPDIVGLHLRPRAGRIGSSFKSLEQILDLNGFNDIPVWLTEFGYPSDPVSQFDSRFASGAESQADYYQQALALLKESGVDRVFVTGRDAPEYPEGSPFLSEGLWQVGQDGFVFKPAYQVFRDNS